MKFRKKPVVIDAVRWDGTEECLCKIALPFLSDGHQGFEHLPRAPDDAHVHNGIGYCPPVGEIYIPTLEGKMTAKPGDWIIRGVKGEFYPCKHDIFAATYEPTSREVSVPEELIKLCRITLGAFEEAQGRERTPLSDMACSMARFILSLNAAPQGGQEQSFAPSHEGHAAGLAVAAPSPAILPPGVERLRRAVEPFVTLVRETSGRIPHEKLSAANWHELCKAAQECDGPAPGGNASPSGADSGADSTERPVAAPSGILKKALIAASTITAPVLAVGEPCEGKSMTVARKGDYVTTERIWHCRCGARSPAECRTETAPQPKAAAGEQVSNGDSGLTGSAPAAAPPEAMPEDPKVWTIWRSPENKWREIPLVSKFDYDALREWAKGLWEQLPEQMKSCTIRLKECEKGHSWLTADNWIQYPCQICRAESAESALKEARERALAAEGVIEAARALTNWLTARSGQPQEAFRLRQALRDYDAAKERG